MKGAPSIFHIGRLDLSFAPKTWTFAAERRAEIDAYFEAARREKPTLLNGRVLLLHRQVVEQGVLRGEYLETDYASFAAWRHWGTSRRRTRLLQCRGIAQCGRRIPACRDGPSHIQRGKNLFSLRHAGSRRCRRRQSRS